MKFDIAIRKAEAYCAMQERSAFEVKRKLYAWGVKNEDFDRIIHRLEKQNFLSEHRFTELFVRSKINQKRWGRNKIRAALKAHNISDALIEEALGNIDRKKYLENFMLLADKKMNDLPGEPEIKQREKLKIFLMSKGYEPELIIEYLNNQHT